MDYIDDDAFDDQMNDYYSDYVWYNMDEEDIIEECERRGILDPDDKEIEKLDKKEMNPSFFLIKLSTY